ncbi:MAG: efflux RND transporter periplasmic adaptor subunit, partial [Planctomycetota bacterium]
RPMIKTRAEILSIVEEGTLAKKGDILAELDKDSVEKDIERLEDAVIKLEADLKNARTDLDIQKGENESNIEKAQLKHEFAKLELERYVKGDHPQQLRQKELRVEQAESRLKQAQSRFEKMPELLEKKFVTMVEVEEKRLQLQSASVELETAKTELELFKDYAHPMNLRQKTADVTEAEREETRVAARGQARLEAKTAVLLQRERQYKAAVSKLDEAKTLLERHTIRAPQDGIVIYGGRRDRWGNDSDQVAVGQPAYPGRTLIELPDLTEMDVRLQVHQADVKKLAKGQSAWITQPGTEAGGLKGVVSEIGSVAQSTNWRDPVKRFEVVVQIHGRVEGLGAGVTVECEVHLGEKEDVLYVPLQTVSSSSGRWYVFVRKDGEVKRRAAVLGVANDTYVQVKEGIEEGDQVLLVNPEMVAEEEAAEKPEGGARGTGMPSGKKTRRLGGRPGGR